MIRTNRFLGSKARSGRQILVYLLLPALLSPAWPQAEPPPPYTQQTPEQLQQLVAPIALYPDSLVAQILAASTFPEQVVEADRWVQAHPDLKGDALGHAADQQPWDPSVKALTAFPSVLGNMDKNLSWTSSLGDAYYNQQPEVMDAIQVMRQRAQQAGNLKSTPQQTVETQGSTIVIQPAAPEVVYVPAYDPWLVYGDPIVAWPGWYPYPGIWWDGPYLSWGIGFEIGWFWGFGWGWGHWGFDWHNHCAIYDHNRYYSHSGPFTTGTISTGVEVSGVEARAARVSTAAACRPGPSTETAGLLEDTRNPAARAASAREPSAAMSAAERHGDFRRVAAPASAAADVGGGVRRRRFRRAWRGGFGARHGGGGHR